MLKEEGFQHMDFEGGDRIQSLLPSSTERLTPQLQLQTWTWNDGQYPGVPVKAICYFTNSLLTANSRIDATARQWWRTPLDPALERQRRADLCEFRARLVTEQVPERAPKLQKHTPPSLSLSKKKSMLHSRLLPNRVI